jgi:hypothetical protein
MPLTVYTEVDAKSADDLWNRWLGPPSSEFSIATCTNQTYVQEISRELDKVLILYDKKGKAASHIFPVDLIRMIADYLLPFLTYKMKLGFPSCLFIRASDIPIYWSVHIRCFRGGKPFDVAVHNYDIKCGVTHAIITRTGESSFRLYSLYSLPEGRAEGRDYFFEATQGFRFCFLSYEFKSHPPSRISICPMT